MPRDHTVFCVCQTCGQTFHPWRSTTCRGLEPKFCSSACHHTQQQAEARERNKRTCRHCGRSFQLKNGFDKGPNGGSFCSVRCHQHSRARLTERLCAHCGTRFSFPEHDLKSKKRHFCSKSCASAARIYPSRRSPHHRDTGEPLWRRKRRIVWKRDGGICHVCCVDVRPTDYHCGHIVDQAVGGSDDLDNLVVMCASCNLTKPFHRSREEYEQWRQDRFRIEDIA